MRKDMVHALIATPTAGGLVKSLYAHTLVKTVLAMKDAGWDVDFELFDGCYVSIARNYFANLLLRKPHYTHLVMVDSDMLFESHVISGGRLRRDSVSVPLSGSSAGWVQSVPLPDLTQGGLSPDRGEARQRRRKFMLPQPAADCHSKNAPASVRQYLNAAALYCRS